VIGGGAIFVFRLFLYGCVLWEFKIEYFCGGLYFSLSPLVHLASILVGVVIGLLIERRNPKNKKSSPQG
jgi:hypothetical protein